MNIPRKAVLTGLALAVLGLSTAASAHDRHDHRYWKHDRHHKHWQQKRWHGRHHDRYYDRHAVRGYNFPPPYIVRERVIMPRPVYVAPPVPYYGRVHNPGVVVRVDVPPIVIPIR